MANNSGAPHSSISLRPFAEILELGENKMLPDVKKSYDANYWTSPLNHQYAKEYYEKPFEDVSLAILKGDECVGYFLATFDGHSLNYYGHPASIFLSQSVTIAERHEASKEVCNWIESFSQSKNCKTLTYLSDSYLDFYFRTKVSNVEHVESGEVWLQRPAEEIKTGIRRRYKSLVNWGQKNLKTVLVDSNNLSEKDFKNFQDLHFSASGRKTRSEKTWDIQFDMIRKGEAFLFLAYDDQNKLVSGVLCAHGKKRCTYFTGASDRERMSQGQPLSHWPMMNAIFHANALGLEFFDIGVIKETNGDPKCVDIANFKAGFATALKRDTKLTVKLTEKE